nr:MAG TPA: hypothetical protein [Caudoviricetes sp.]
MSKVLRMMSYLFLFAKRMKIKTECQLITFQIKR